MLTNTDAIRMCLECDTNNDVLLNGKPNDAHPKIVRRGWSAEEDHLIVAFVGSGENWPPNWRRLAAIIYERLHFYRSDDAVRNRWKRLQREVKEPKSYKGPYARRIYWTTTEDALILQFVGSRPSWKTIASMIPGRTAHAIRNRHARLVSKLNCM